MRSQAGLTVSEARPTVDREKSGRSDSEWAVQQWIERSQAGLTVSGPSNSGLREGDREGKPS